MEVPPAIPTDPDRTHAMGESQCSLFQPEFNRSIRVEARRERLSADAGALLLRELMDRLGYPALFGKHLRDPRDSFRVKHPQVELLRTALLMLAQGWSAHSDVRLSCERTRLCAWRSPRVALSARCGKGARERWRVSARSPRSRGFWRR